MKFVKPITALLATAVIGTQLFACGKSNDDAGFDYSKGLDSNGFFAGIKAADIVTLPEYKGIDIDPSVFIADEDEVQNQIEYVLSNYVDYEKVTDRAVKDGDSVNIDYVGTIDGVAFAGGTTNGYGTTVTIGVTQYIDDFLEQLIGHKPGETFDVEVTFPTEYKNNPDLAGKDAVFSTTINYIQGDEIVPELTVEIAANYGFDSIDAMIEDIKDFVVNYQKNDAFYDILNAAVCDNIPQAVIDYVIDHDLDQLTYEAKSYYGMTLEQYITSFSDYKSTQEYIDAMMEDYKAIAVQYLAAQAIAEKEGLTVSKQDIEDAGYSDMIETYGEPYLKQTILFQDKIPNLIFDNANVK
ncbi:MAG: hypothetical protein HFE63_03055 [Clostridiales bacterium]|nr:hypothetical protein [Clostridiales bacterium]